MCSVLDPSSTSAESGRTCSEAKRPKTGGGPNVELPWFTDIVLDAIGGGGGGGGAADDPHNRNV